MLQSLCRLCLSSDFLLNLYEMEGDTCLSVKVDSCINIQLHQEDGLPTAICLDCKYKIQEFYDFKESCLKVQEKLKINYTPQDLVKADSGGHFIDQNECISSPSDTHCLPDVNQEYGDEVSNKTSNGNGLHLKEKVISKVIDTEHDTIQCELCGHLIFGRAKFRKHLVSHRINLKRFQCDHCPKSFTRKENHIIHIRSHHLGIKPFTCEICGQSLTKSQDLNRHMKIHSDARDYTCITCGRCFKRSFDLYNHMRTHTGVRPYKCKLCEKDYTSHSGLTSHYKKHSYLEQTFENTEETI